MKRRSTWLTTGVVILVAIAGVLAGVFYAVRFTNAVNQSHTAPGTAVASGTPVPSAGLQTYQIVPAQTSASYSVYENLIFQNKPNNDAIGTTHAVAGNFQARTSPSPLIAAMNIKVDLRTLQTDSSMRDNYVRRHALETDSYPYATFVSVSTQGLPDSYADGQAVHFQLTGNLSMHGKTNKAVFDVQGKLESKTITGTATSTIYMTDYGIQPPNLANVAVSQNKVLVTLNFTAQAS